ncbi:MAG: GGDEF domain-containing protein, partial [Coriobacteriales bacterium]|nr:GGDEF domain-containing protein [Coriobacteriales bacterium]
NTDALTQLYNRRYAHQYFEKIRADVPRLDWCIAMLDIDNFKTINDTYGHAVGDAVLTELAVQLTSMLRQTDLVFRWGGEEFLILLLARNVDIAYNVLDKVRRRLATSQEIEEHVGLRFTVTLGVSKLDLDAIEQSIESCDQKLYLGKNSGKNKAVR